MEKVTADWWKLHSVGLHNSCFATNIVRVRESRRVSWTGNVAHMGQMRNEHRI
jgi:hypothetical protein